MSMWGDDLKGQKSLSLNLYFALAWVLLLLVASLFTPFFVSLLGYDKFMSIDRSCLGACPPLFQGDYYHWIGTDSLGRDVLAQLIAGTRTALTIGVFASFFSWLLGYTIGSGATWFSRGGRRLSWFAVLVLILTLAAVYYFYEYQSKPLVAVLSTVVLGLALFVYTIRKPTSTGLRTDRALLFISEVLSSVPGLLLLLALSSLALKTGPFLIVFVLVFVSWTKFAVLALKETQLAMIAPYTLSAIKAGIPSYQVFFRHILPNINAPLRVLAVISISSFIAVENTLSFLGMGLMPNQASWGTVLKEAVIVDGWWLWFFPGFVLIITVLSLRTIANRL